MAGRIPQTFIDELVARADIVEVIGRRVPLKKAGREHKACCPFHDEKTPSFTVVPQKQFYHCFGCGAHGTAIGFLMEYDHMGFVEAVEELATQLGLEVPREEGPDERPETSLYDVLEAAAAFFRDCLKNSEAAKTYLRGRGLTGETAARFGIGYAPDDWNALLGRLGRSDHDRQRLVTAGLIIAKDGGGHYDRFRDRIMFPIRDARGRSIAFGGRITNKGEPKYLNSPETPLFHKGRELYGLYEARTCLRDIPRLIVVEGYMDVVGLARHGIDNAVATLGTATTGEHLERVFRVTDEVVFCFDGDRAGREAAWRALGNALPGLREGRQLKFLFLPDGQDPDSLVNTEGARAFTARLAQAIPLSDFLIRRLTDGVDMETVDGRARLAELARPLINRVPPGVYKELLIEKLADTVGLSVERLEPLLAGNAGEPLRPRRIARPVAQAGRSNLVRKAIALLLQYPSLAKEAADLDDLRRIDRPGVSLLAALIDDLQGRGTLTTAGVLERWRHHEHYEALAKLAREQMLEDEEMAVTVFRNATERLVRQEALDRMDELVRKAAETELTASEKAELRGLHAVVGKPLEQANQA
ncbi:MAG: DNA primase [Gammaproteobacteria bacterium]|nr:DNA primase [Gammaproteobacteria bacterium]